MYGVALAVPPETDFSRLIDEPLLPINPREPAVTTSSPLRLREYWDWFAVALFVLITLDMLSSRYAAATAGAYGEVNPLMRWVLRQHVFVLATVNVLAGIIAVGSFSVLMALLESSRSPYDRYLAWGIELWLGGLIAVGLFVFANNLSVIVHGQSLIPFD